MEHQKLTVSQNKLEFLIALGFGAIILVSASTEIGYIPLDSGRHLDMAIIPAMFAAMIGGYRVAIPVGTLWAFLAFHNIGITDSSLAFYGMLINKLVLVTVAYAAYKACKKIYPYSPANVYRAIFIAISAKSLAYNLFMWWYVVEKEFLTLEEWVLSSTQQYVMEVALCSLAMMLLIKHLRQIHILNGVKRREKAKKKRPSEASVNN